MAGCVQRGVNDRILIRHLRSTVSVEPLTGGTLRYFRPIPKLGRSGALGSGVTRGVWGFGPHRAVLVRGCKRAKTVNHVKIQTVSLVCVCVQ